MLLLMIILNSPSAFANFLNPSFNSLFILFLSTALGAIFFVTIIVSLRAPGLFLKTKTRSLDIAFWVGRLLIFKRGQHQTASFDLFLALLLFITFCPPEVCILFLNPCVLALFFFFGW